MTTKPYTPEIDLDDLNRKTIYANWCESIMTKVEEIANKKYPNTPYWCDTGSRWNVCMAMLEEFEKDLGVRK